MDVGSGHVHTENLDWDVDNLPVFDDDDGDDDDEDDDDDDDDDTRQDKTLNVVQV